jgi:hypothetical protein
LQILISDRRISTGCSVRLKMWSHEKKFIIWIMIKYKRNQVYYTSWNFY